jgi:hypothetical protein
MASYVESATLIVLDEASKPVNAITKELRALARAASTLKDAFKSNNSADKLNVLSRTMDTAARQARRMRSELAGVNAELSKMASLGVRAGRGGSSTSAAALGIVPKSAIRLQAEAARADSQKSREAAKATESVARASGMAQIDIAREVARAQTQAEKDVAATKRDAVRQAESVARASGNAQIEISREVARAQTSAEKEIAVARREAARDAGKAAKSQAVALRDEAREAGNATRELNRLAAAEDRAARAERAETAASIGHNARGFAHGSGLFSRTALMAGGGGFLAGRAVEKLWDAGADLASERSSAVTQGLSPAQSAKLEDAARKASAETQSMSVASLFRLGRGVSNILPTRDEAVSALSDAAKLAQTIKRQSPKESDDEIGVKVESAFKALEDAGLTKNAGDFKAGLAAEARAMNTFGAQFDPKQLLQMVKYSRQAALQLDPDFLMTVGPILGQMLKGSSAGQALAGFNKEIVGTVRNGDEAKAWDKLGLLDKSLLIKNKKGEVTGWRAGAVKDWRKGQARPDEFIGDQIVPALIKAGFTNPKDQLAKLVELFPNRVVGQLAQILVTQSARITKEVQNIKSAGDQNAAGASGDPKLALAAAESQFTNVLANLADYAMPGATRALVRAANFANKYAEDIRSHRGAAAITTAEMGVGGVGAALLAKRALGFVTGMSAVKAATAANTIATDVNTATLRKSLVASKVAGAANGVAGGIEAAAIGARGAGVGGKLLRLAGALTEVGGAVWLADAALDAFAPDLRDKFSDALGKAIKDIRLDAGLDPDSPAAKKARQYQTAQDYKSRQQWLFDNTGGGAGQDFRSQPQDAIEASLKRQAAARKVTSDHARYERSQDDIRTGKDHFWSDKTDAVKALVASIVAEIKGIGADKKALPLSISEMVDRDYKDRRDAARNPLAFGDSPEARHGKALGELSIAEISDSISRTSHGLDSLAEPASHAGNALALIPGTAESFNGALSSMVERLNSAHISISVAAPAGAPTGGMPAPHG